MIKTRFCPSPTGLMHFGNARTALFNALAAYAQGGTFLLRIEDTDAERSKSEFVEQLKADLSWLGLAWQEGPGQDQGAGPYFQSERASIYEKYYQQLIDQDRAYPCFCSEEQLARSRKMQRRQGQPPRYAGTCCHLTQGAIEKKFAEGLSPTLRFRVPEDEVVEFDDLVRGKQSFKTKDLGDFIIRRSAGTSSFMFCNAIDDAMMGVTLAMRGEDHLTNSPRQILILQALGLTPPRYGHISLIVGKDNSPLSKRHGSKSVAELREQGYLPVAIVNYLARLGHVYMDHNELMSLADCAKYFDAARLVKAAAKFDEQQLLHWQKEAVLQLSDEKLAEWLEDVTASLSASQQTAFVGLIKSNIVFPSDAAYWFAQLEGDHAKVSDEAVIREAGKAFFESAIERLSQEGCDYAALVDHLKEALSVKGKQLFMPLRMALTGERHGPELAATFDYLGSEKVTNRFKYALSLCE